jgi:phosphate transport system substrate-binding protein
MTMKNKLSPGAAVKVIGGLLFLLPALLLVNCTQRPVGETAKSGRMTIAVDKPLEEITGSQAETFSRYYPDARITIIPVTSRKSLKYLLDGKVNAALISGETEAGEDSLFAKLKRPLRREPVARDAIVCIVNRRNPSIMLSIKELAALFSERENDGVTPLVTTDDFRILSLLAATTGKKRTELHPWACSSDAALIERVSADKRAVGLLFRSSFDRALTVALKQGKRESNIRIVPLAKESTVAEAFLPTQQNIFEGRYPLVATVYYVYYPGEALAAGFGSWLGSSGQKAFERSSLAPFRLVERTIILK